MTNLTGQLIFRDAGAVKNGKKLYMVVGIVGFDGDVPVEGEHQYAVAGGDIPDTHQLRMNVFTQSGVDVSPVSIGSDLGYLVTRPIWRV